MAARTSTLPSLNPLQNASQLPVRIIGPGLPLSSISSCTITESKPSNNLLQLTKNAIHSAQELSRSPQSNQLTRDGANKLQDVLQAVASDPSSLPEIRPLVIYCDTACRFLLNTTSATNARTSSVTLQDSTEPAEHDISAIERMLLTYVFVMEISLAIATASSTANGTVLEAKFILEKHLEKVKSKIWNTTEREHATTERDTLKGDLEACERVSGLLSSIEGGHGQVKEIAQTARKSLQIIEHKFSQQDRLEEEEDCLKICLTVCGQALVDSSRPTLKNFVLEKDTARILPADRGTGNLQTELGETVPCLRRILERWRRTTGHWTRTWGANFD